MTALPIEQVDLFCGEYEANLTYSTWTTTRCRGIVVRVRAGGLIGWGEVSRGRAGTPVGEGSYALAREWAGVLLGRDASNPAEALRDPGASGVEDPWQDGHDAVRRQVREAFCIALYDAAAKAQGVPMYALLGTPVRSEAPGMPVIHVRPVPEMAALARQWAGEGYRFLKIKLRGDVERDAETVAAIREAVGAEIGLHVDFNLGFARTEDAAALARRIEPHRIDVFEDPLQGDAAAYAELRREIALPLMIDNYSWWPIVEEVVARRAVDIINHHPSIQGGPDLIGRIDRLATDAGMRTAIGSGGTFGIQDAAFQNMAAVFSPTRPCEDIGPHAQFRFGRGESDGVAFNPEVVVTPYPQNRGVISIPSAPGLGIEVDEAKLLSFATERCAVSRRRGRTVCQDA